MKYSVAPFNKSKFVQLNTFLSDIKTSYSIFKSSVPLLKIHDASYNTDIFLLWTITADLADTEFHIILTFLIMRPITYVQHNKILT